MKTIEQTIDLPAPPAAVYDALMNPEKHATFTGDVAEISPAVGGRFSAFGGKIGGLNLELVENKRIVQAWRPANFPEGVFTLATFALAAHEGGTRLTFTQTSVPDGAHAMLDSGWHDRYWKPLKKYLENRS